MRVDFSLSLFYNCVRADIVDLTMKENERVYMYVKSYEMRI